LTDKPAGWKVLLPAGSWDRRPGAHPIPAYSEFMPPPPVGRRAYGGSADPVLFQAEDPFGWHVTEYEQAFELAPGLAHLATEILRALQRLGRRRGGHGIGRAKLYGNPFWPEPLLTAGAPPHERYLALLPLALSRTQDDKGRVRWTLFGASEQGPARPFWQGFFTAPGQEAPVADALAFCRRLVSAVAGEPTTSPTTPTTPTTPSLGVPPSDGEAPKTAEAATRDLLAAGFRILPGGMASAEERAQLGFWDDGPLPSWVAPLSWAPGEPLAGVRYLLTFRPFASLPQPVREAYQAGNLHLLPFPGSLLFWGAEPYRGLARELPLALQIPLLHPIERSEDPHYLRVPQSGWLHEPHAGQPRPATEHGPVRNTFRRTHRWARVERQEDELAVAGSEDRMAHVLFSAAADDLGLYGKPMARNAQLWTDDYHLLLDGPRAGRAELIAAARRLEQGGTFGYRFLYPAMRAGAHEVYWHLPLAAIPAIPAIPAVGAAGAATPPDTADAANLAEIAGVADGADAAGAAGVARAAGAAAAAHAEIAAVAKIIPGGPLGYLTAYDKATPDLAHPVELWPRLLSRPAHRAAIDELRGGRFSGAAGPRENTAEPGAGVTAAAAAARLSPADYAGYRRTVNNARKTLEAWDLLGRAPLAASFARALLRLPKGETLERWLAALDEVAAKLGRTSPALAEELRSRIAPAVPAAANSSESTAAEPKAAATSSEPAGNSSAPGAISSDGAANSSAPTAPSSDGAAGARAAASTPLTTSSAPAAAAPEAAAPLTFHLTSRRRFEEAYWRRIAFLAAGRFVNKDNADVVRDHATQAHLAHYQRDLDALAEYLLAYYRRLIDARGMAGRAVTGDLPFRWQTDFSFDWSGGWLANQAGDLEERNLLTVIPGRDRGRAIIMADHYDTAYMEDRYGYQHGGHGPRLAAAGADDNHSATVALMLAAPIFLEMSRAGQLACDIWLVHLTGEEFPSDCMGARHLAQSLLEGTLKLRSRPSLGGPAARRAAGGRLAAPRAAGGRLEAPGAAGAQLAAPRTAGGEIWTDLSATRVDGVYVLDMIAHNNDRDRDIFQMCPGTGGASMWLALQAHLANHAWNRLAPGWNRRGRRGCKRGRRSGDGRTMPAKALHPELHGQVRPVIDPHSTLYNTDGQIFSDAGVPVVLFMENYDINRHGYHDSHDTMENIDLDYGAAVAAISIEAVARAATLPAPAS
jgi:hypothetical protein